MESTGRSLKKTYCPNCISTINFSNPYLEATTIDISPQGSIGIDLGYRYQRNDNPVASVINRRSPGLDFDQRISLSLLGKIGERLQITANYDTESTFDFQNLVKIQFNPPQLSEIPGLIPGKLGSNINRLQEGVSQRVDQVKEVCQ